MTTDVQHRTAARSSASDACPEHHLPLFPTVVGPRCPVCGVAAVWSPRLAG